MVIKYKIVFRINSADRTQSAPVKQECHCLVAVGRYDNFYITKLGK